jgi:HEPN domain-containing protein
MSPEDARTHLTREWLTKASHDLRGATLASSAQAALWDIAAFHAQQAAEKALKAFLAWHDVPFRRTHNLVELLEECEVIDAAFASLRVPAEFLTRFAVDPRYPGMAAEPNAEIAERAVQQAREVVSFVLARLPEQVRP